MCASNLYKSHDAWLFAVAMVEEGFILQFHGPEEVPSLCQRTNKGYPLNGWEESKSVFVRCLLLFCSFSPIHNEVCSFVQSPKPCSRTLARTKHAVTVIMIFLKTFADRVQGKAVLAKRPRYCRLVEEAGM